MCGDMSLWNVQGPLLHSGDTLVQCILTVDYTFSFELLGRLYTRQVLSLKSIWVADILGRVRFCHDMRHKMWGRVKRGKIGPWK